MSRARRLLEAMGIDPLGSHDTPPPSQAPRPHFIQPPQAPRRVGPQASLDPTDPRITGGGPIPRRPGLDTETAHDDRIDNPDSHFLSGKRTPPVDDAPLFRAANRRRR